MPKGGGLSGKPRLTVTLETVAAQYVERDGHAAATKIEVSGLTGAKHTTAFLVSVSGSTCRES